MAYGSEVLVRTPWRGGRLAGWRSLHGSSILRRIIRRPVASARSTLIRRAPTLPLGNAHRQQPILKTGCDALGFEPLAQDKASSILSWHADPLTVRTCPLAPAVRGEWEQPKS